MGSDYWKGLLDWIKDVMLDKCGYISPEDLDVYTVEDDPLKVTKILVDFREQNGRSGLKQPPGLKRSVYHH
jgi:predicted Rossmann-fold nucleotide-binding protein